MTQEKAKQIVSISPDLRLELDDHNYTLKRRHLVDPTRAPGYKAPADGSIPPTSEKWLDIGYYPVSPRGFVAAVQAAVLRVDTEGVDTLAGLVAAYKAEAERLSALIEREVSV
ncbi:MULTISPECIES: hypothetical protein [Paenibacillus]|uniref:hypothetical protein n=1 Tax=Paenibacillus TaxID=44249 RepID=UPI00038FEEE9|nr:MULTISPECIES: hypothetical protein [Paenibacillus]CDN42011.1 hypothetical protein BN871_AT_00130 [Paenibacillus sp. P22]